ncbi:hypothetical protein B9Z19DRAFT_1066806 [Tuber borchii]|uniref:GAR domain-containing protein n=1 Tax=Tuber borchii TaxID=42251 RepID=A0A2T6ZL50_TUBBO|nr:hypothetical protein B9Z19DRAFT_1066806 [Tuber borchii]
MFYPRRTTSSHNPYAPSTSLPLSPHSTSFPSLETSAAITNSHYYRPARSAISSSTHSSTRTSRQFRVQSLLPTDPLLCNLTPGTIIRLSTSGDVDFEPGEKEGSLRAAEGIVKVNEWLGEVEGWNREWRRTYRESKDTGDGYLPPAERPEKRRKIGMDSIREEEGGAMLDSSKPVRRGPFSKDNGTGESGGGIVKGERPEVGAVESPKPQTNSPSLKLGGEPLTPYQSKMQRQRVAEVDNGLTLVDGRSEPDQILDKPVERIGAKEGRDGEEEEGEEDDQEDELEECAEYWGSLKRSIVQGYETRIEVIKSEIEKLGVDGLKDRVLADCDSPADLLTDSSAIMATTTLQLLPPLSRLTKLLSIWASRIAILRIVPVFLRSLQIARDALEAGYTAITHPSINPESGSLDGDWRGLAKESYTPMQETITQKVATAGMLMDTMLDALEGHEDVLPEKWIGELEDVEEGVGRWEMDGERVVLQGRLRHEEMIITKLAEEKVKTLEPEARKVAELGARRRAEEQEPAEKARPELEAEKAAEAKRLLRAEEAAQKEKAAELERLAEVERQCLDAQPHEEESAAAKALEERRVIEAERAAVVEAARQVFVREQGGFDDKKFQELDRQRQLAEDEQVRLADMASAEREKAREAKQQRKRETEEERVKVETSGFSSPTGLGETVEQGMLPIELSEKVKRKISRDPTRATSVSKNRSVAPRSSTPTLGKALAKDQKEKFTLGLSSSAPGTTAGYKRPTSRAEARFSGRQGNRPASRGQEFRSPSKVPDNKTARPSSQAGPSTPVGPNSSTPAGTPAPAIRAVQRLRCDTVSTTGADSVDGDDSRRFFLENTQEMNNSDLAKAPKLQVAMRRARQPSDFTSIPTPEKSPRFNKSSCVAEGSSLVLPTTPMLQVDLDDRINEILGSLSSKVHLTASNLQTLSESTKPLPLINPLDLSPTGIQGPLSVESSSSIASEVPSYVRASARKHSLSSPGDIKLYHLHLTDGQAPIKLYIRLVGENGERVMVRVGGGWADLAEYLKEYVAHHGLKKGCYESPIARENLYERGGT